VILTQSFSRHVTKTRPHWVTFTTDLEDYEGIDIQQNFMQDNEFIDVNFFTSNLCWASPPCTTYSVAGLRHHREGWKPKSEMAKAHDLVMIKLLQYIKTNLEYNPKFRFIIENPRAMLRKMPFMQEFEKYRKTVTYCQYGYFAMKPTDIWTNIPFNPKKCKNGDPCHEPAPRGTKQGIQRLSKHQRNKVPSALIEDLLLAYEGGF
jgi:hypothetical protein